MLKKTGEILSKLPPRHRLTPARYILKLFVKKGDIYLKTYTHDMFLYYLQFISRDLFRKIFIFVTTEKGFEDVQWSMSFLAPIIRMLFNFVKLKPLEQKFSTFYSCVIDSPFYGIKNEEYRFEKCYPMSDNLTFKLLNRYLFGIESREQPSRDVLLLFIVAVRCLKYKYHNVFESGNRFSPKIHFALDIEIPLKHVIQLIIDNSGSFEKFSEAFDQFEFKIYYDCIVHSNHMLTGKLKDIIDKIRNYDIIGFDSLNKEQKPIFIKAVFDMSLAGDMDQLCKKYNKKQMFFSLEQEHSSEKNLGDLNDAHYIITKRFSDFIAKKPTSLEDQIVKIAHIDPGTLMIFHMFESVIKNQPTTCPMYWFKNYENYKHAELFKVCDVKIQPINDYNKFMIDIQMESFASGFISRHLPQHFKRLKSALQNIPPLPYSSYSKNQNTTQTKI